MKKQSLLFPFLLLLLGAAAVSVLGGCGRQTSQASDLQHEADALIAQVRTNFNEADNLLSRATTELSRGQKEAEKVSLIQAKEQIDAALAGVAAAKDKIDEACRLDISEAYREYLLARGRSFDVAQSLAATRLSTMELLLADLSIEAPDTLQKLMDLQQKAKEQGEQLLAAEDEATRIADEHPDEIK